MILKALQLEMTSTRNEYVSVSNELTVEHLLPQKGSLEDYPYSDEELDDDYTREEYRDDLLHTIGNLTLLTRALNSSISNGPFRQKAASIADESDLRINAWVRKETPEKWDESDIEVRSGKLFEYAKRIWPSPDDST